MAQVGGSVTQTTAPAAPGSRKPKVAQQTPMRHMSTRGRLWACPQLLPMIASCAVCRPVEKRGLPDLSLDPSRLMVCSMLAECWTLGFHDVEPTPTERRAELRGCRPTPTNERCGNLSAAMRRDCSRM